MASPIKPSNWCATVVDASAALCAKIESFFQVPELLCEYFGWNYTEAGEFSDAYKAMLQTAVGVPTGAMLFWPIATVPDGYLEANGQAVGRLDYPALFAIYGTAYGEGNQLTTFNLPDLRDRFPMGRSGTHPVGTSGGITDVTLTADNIPAHAHGLPDGVMTWPGQHKSKFDVDSSGNDIDVTTATSTDETGGDQPFSVQNKYLAGVWIIKT